MVMMEDPTSAAAMITSNSNSSNAGLIDDAGEEEEEERGYNNNKNIIVGGGSSSLLERRRRRNKQRQQQQRQQQQRSSNRMPRQWIVDRCDGTSQYDPESRPPCRACWAPVPIKWCPDLLEQNCCCEYMGKIGFRATNCTDPETNRVRRPLFQAVFVINVIGLALLVVSAFSITDDNFDLLWNTKFTDVWLELVQVEEENVNSNGTIANSNNGTDLNNNGLSFNYTIHVPLQFAIGLRAIAITNLWTGRRRLLSFADACQISSATYEDLVLLKRANEPKFECNNCESISRKIVPSLFLSMLSYIPNYTTDILRMYYNYDCNCQKFLASTFSWISLCTSIYTWVNYRQGCFDSLDTDPFALNENFEEVPIGSDDAAVVVQFQWTAGLGQICLLLATLLKFIDILINIILPTPSITRDHQEQVEYENLYGKTNSAVIAADDDGGDEGEEKDSETPK